MYHGSTPISRVYKGSTLVFQSGVAPGPAFGSKKGSFAAPTSGGGTVTLAFPFNVKFLMLHGNGMTTTSGAVAGDEHRKVCIGWATDATTRRAIATQIQEGAAVSVTDHKHSDTAVYMALNQSTGADNGMLDIQSWDWDGTETEIVLTADTAFSAAFRVFYWAVGGTDVEAGLSTHQEPGSTGGQALTVPVSNANLFLFMGVAHATAPADTHATDTGVHANHFFGAADSAGGQAVAAVGSEDDVGTSDAGQYLRSGQCIAMMPGDPNSLDARAAFSSVSGTTLNLSWAERTGTRYFFVASIKVPNAKVGTCTMPSGHPQTASVTTTFTPDAGIVFSHRKAEDADDTPAAGYVYCMGQFANDEHGADLEGCWGNLERDNQGTIDGCVAISVTDDILVCPTTTATIGELFDIDSRSGTGITYRTDDGSVVNVFLASILVGD